LNATSGKRNAMPKYNTSFDLDVDDLDLIEEALRARKKSLSLRRLSMLGSDGPPPDAGSLAVLDARIKATHDLLGRLHNQKVFYRPRRTQPAPYISG